MTEPVVHRFDNGLQLAVEVVDGARSASVTLLLPVGAASDPADAEGCSTLLSELVLRGAGALDSRGYSDAMDRLGAIRGTSVGRTNLSFTLQTTGEHVPAALALMADAVRRPRLPEDALEGVRALAIGELEGLDDDPARLLDVHLRAAHLPAPFDRSGLGRLEVLESAGLAQLRAHWAERARPDGAFLGIAGAVDPAAIRDAVAACFGDWRGATPEPRATSVPPRGRRHVAHDSAQVQIGIAWDAPPAQDEHVALERVAIDVLGGASSSRLFTEVRARRGLCYAVHAGYVPAREHAYASIYSGTTPERAAETLDTCLAELRRLGEGVAADEFDRSLLGLRARLVMSGESTAARAAAIASDLHRLGRARSLDEIRAELDAVTLTRLNRHLADRPAPEPTIVTLGPEPHAPTVDGPAGCGAAAGSV